MGIPAHAPAEVPRRADRVARPVCPLPPLPSLVELTTSEAERKAPAAATAFAGHAPALFSACVAPCDRAQVRGSRRALTDPPRQRSRISRTKAKRCGPPAPTAIGPHRLQTGNSQPCFGPDGCSVALRPRPSTMKASTADAIEADLCGIAEARCPSSSSVAWSTTRPASSLRLVSSGTGKPARHRALPYPCRTQASPAPAPLTSTSDLAAKQLPARAPLPAPERGSPPHPTRRRSSPTTRRR